MKIQYIVLLLLFNNCIGQTKSQINQKEVKPTFSILGKWKLLKRISLDESNPLSEKESFECSGSLMTFTNDSFSIITNSCFVKYDCPNPNYKIQTVNTAKYFEDDKSYIKLLDLKDYIKVLTYNCSVTFASIIILDIDNICFGMDGYEYFLKRK